MKNTSFLPSILILGVGLFLSACGSKGTSPSDDLRDKLPVMAMMDSTTFDFGIINEGEVVEHSFRFKNDGEFPLIINNVTASCGCTIPEWPRDPIAPQEESTILVRFNSKGKPGPQVKTITVYANTDPAYSELRLQGVVETGADTTTVQ